VVLHSWMIANKLVWSVAKLSALPGCITEWNSGQIYVRISISSHKFEETSENIASVVAESSEFWAASIRVANQEFDQ